MNNSRPVESTAGMTVSDVYYVLFRHKWKILLFSVAGFLAAAALYHFRPPLYESQAELLIKYIPEARPLVLGGETILPGSEVEDVINSEIEILTSLDLAEEVVTNLGASTILDQAGGGDDALAAAAMVRNNLHAEPTIRGSSVILVTFRHHSPQVVQPVLREVIEDYFRKHNEIHQAVGQFDDNLSRERSDLQVELDATEKALAELKNKASILSLDDTRNNLGMQISKIENSILDAKAELGQYGVISREVEKPAAKPATNTLAAVPSDQVNTYEDLRARLSYLKKKQQDYIDQGFAPKNIMVTEVAKQIVDAQKSVTDMEKKFPDLKDYNSSLAALDRQPATEPVSTGASAADDKIAALKAKIGAWQWQLGQLWEQASNINNLAPEIAELERTKQIQETNYENLAISLEQAHINAALATDKAPNIKTVQTPSPPFQEWKKTYQRMAVLAFGGILAGLACAFMIELYLDRSVKRPIEVETKLKMPLFLSIPDVSRNGHAQLARAAERRQLRLTNPAEGDEVAADGIGVPARRDTGVEVVSLENNRSLHGFFDALRDRLVLYFEVKNLTHNPKLVAVTSANNGSGVSTIASGLAASLSETGDGNVLLVDMNREHAAAQKFYKGKQVCGLDTALASETRNEAQVQENLYVVSEDSSGDTLPRILPKRFSNLMPKFRASEYDYIIFDMPAVSPTSATPRIARFMDMVLMVIESEKTDRDVVERANKLLVESGATVSAVLNKTRKYVPKSLNGYLGDS
jgi:uncharacterized protein involved in exopolysaccharide biosynthesis/Mrp family chromosome partitioning ATPase